MIGKSIGKIIGKDIIRYVGRVRLGANSSVTPLLFYPFEIENGGLKDYGDGGNNGVLTLRNCVIGDGVKEFTFASLPTYDAITIEKDGVETAISLTALKYVPAVGNHNYIIFKNAGSEVAKFPLMEHDIYKSIPSTTQNFYDVLNSGATCSFNGVSANFGKQTGVSYNFQYGFAEILGDDTRYPALENDLTEYGGVDFDDVNNYNKPFSIRADQYFRIPDAAKALDVGNQFTSGGSVVDIAFSDIVNNSNTIIELDGDEIIKLQIGN